MPPAPVAIDPQRLRRSNSNAIYLLGQALSHRCREYTPTVWRLLRRWFIASLRYESGFQDPLLAEIAYAIVSELQTQTAAGRLLAETFACSLAARLVQNHVSSSPAEASPRITKEGLENDPAASA